MRFLEENIKKKKMCIELWFGVPVKVNAHLETEVGVIGSRSCRERVALFYHCLGQKLAKGAESNYANSEALGRR